MTTKNISRHCTISPGGTKSPPVENHWFGTVVPVGTGQADYVITLLGAFVYSQVPEFLLRLPEQAMGAEALDHQSA